ncbi:MAG: hypothetical protein COW42_14820 [Deltaproteobacteria bacterium CG17_big_fil_post_rev_8_21_14_2_50_63_7]|nr:MAG: hypothetical protein COW42_14820 [Deltaproteobacteria bacterium CG17_big_fil_post_rev_8_21_14_2_50_63_7]
MNHHHPNTALALLFALAITFTAGVAAAEEGSDSSSSSSDLSLAVTIGESAYFIDGSAYRGPVTLEAVPSIGWSMLEVDLGLCATLESIKVAGTNIGDWNFAFRPGVRVAPPILPLYLRAAIPLQIYENDFDWGFMFGVGAQLPVLPMLALVLEVDTALTKNLEWGGKGVPLEFRAGASISF